MGDNLVAEVKKLRYQIFVTVWGREHVYKFLRYSLTSQLLPRNIRELSQYSEIVYRIYTDKDSHSFFYPEILKLEKFAKIEFVFYEELTFKGANLLEVIKNSDPTIVKHNVQRLTSKHHMDIASSLKDTAVILLDSDFIFSDGSFLHLHEVRKSGKKGYAAMFLRLHQEKAVGELDLKLPDFLSSRDLVKISLECMHPITQSMAVGAKRPTAYPSQINWSVGGEGIIGTTPFPHPLMIVMGPVAPNFFSTMDYELILKAISKNDEIFYCTSSEDLMLCKMSPKTYGAEVPIISEQSVKTSAKFVLENTNIRHSYFMKQPVKFFAKRSFAEFAEKEHLIREYIEDVYFIVEKLLSEMGTGDVEKVLKIKSYLGDIEEFLSPQIHGRIKKYL